MSFEEFMYVYRCKYVCVSCVLVSMLLAPPCVQINFMSFCTCTYKLITLCYCVFVTGLQPFVAQAFEGQCLNSTLHLFQVGDYEHLCKQQFSSRTSSISTYSCLNQLPICRTYVLLWNIPNRCTLGKVGCGFDCDEWAMFTHVLSLFDANMCCAQSGVLLLQTLGCLQPSCKTNCCLPHDRFISADLSSRSWRDQRMPASVCSHQCKAVWLTAKANIEINSSLGRLLFFKAG